VADQLAAGRVGRAHGLDGSFHVTRAEAGMLTQGSEVFVEDVAHTIVRLAGTAANPIVRLSGLDTRPAVEALRGSTLKVDASLAPPLGEDEYRQEDLIGCRVGDGTREVGEVTGVLALPSCEALEVRRDAEADAAQTGGSGGSAGAALIVPLVRDAIRSVDLAARHIDVDMGFVGG
jgi:16S rRNA processing protein RimM